MLTKTKNFIKSPFIQQFRDNRALVLVAFAVLAVLLTWSGIKAVQTNYKLQKQISALQQEIEVNKLENDNLKLTNEYYNTDRFLELAARRQFGKAAPGETVINVPKQVALRYAKTAPDVSTTVKTEAEVKKPAYQKHFQDWIDFFLHR